MAQQPKADAACRIDVGQGKPVAVRLAASEQFARRLIKVARQRRRWADQNGITCYRVYDADLPDYSCVIDLYEGAPETPGRWLMIAEYAAPASVDPELARTRMDDVLALAPRILGVESEHVHARVRSHSKGGSQYGRQTASEVDAATDGDLDPAAIAAAPREPRRIERLPQIEEGGLRFYVNLEDYLDTGIFLDHRVTRALVRDHALRARSFLNLFCYTGTATCYAAHAGVQYTTSVDLSNTYLAWARRNMDLNQLSSPRDEFVRADVVRWIERERHTRHRWDLIFCDPPTFSNSAKMGRQTFEIQRDHVELLIGVSRLLARGGEAIFSCNLRGFKPRYDALVRAGVVLTDISDQTIPEDFARNKRIHHCYLLHRTTPEEAQRQLEHRAGERRFVGARQPA